VEGVQCLGFEIDEAKNRKQVEDVVTDITQSGAKYKTLVVQTDEQLEMARGVMVDRAQFVPK
jgi:acetate kinase